MGTKITIHDIDKNHINEIYIENILFYKTLWANQDSNIIEIKKIDMFQHIETWKDIDHDLYRLLILMNINNENKVLLKKIMGIMIYDIFYNLKMEAYMLKIIKNNNDVFIDYFLSASTKQDSIEHNKNKEHPKLELVINNGSK